MYKFDNDMYLENLPVLVYKKLFTELNKHNRWNQLAEYICDKLGFANASWIKYLNNDESNGTKKTPGENLLDQLNMRMCTVEILGHLLKDSELLDALSIIHQPEPLIIIQHPNNQVLEKEIALNDILILECKAIGLPPPTYTWYHNDTILKIQGNALKILIDNINQEGEYKCHVKQIDSDDNVLDQLFSNSVHLKIQPTPVVIKSQPQPFIAIKENETLTLTCKAYSHPNPKYQWYKNNIKLDDQQSEKLEIKKFSCKHEGKYYCYVSNGINETISEKSTVIIDLPREKAVAKIALLIANENYDCYEKLNIPRKDVAKLGQLLKEIGFQVICLLNLTIQQMKNAIKIFKSFLSEGVYGLFYFAGHGFKMQECYMLAVDAPKTALRNDAVCESELLATLLPTDPALLVIILDMCQTLPSKQLNPCIYAEIPIVNEYKSNSNLRNLIQAYSTSSYCPSYEHSKNEYGLYVLHLIKYITKDLPIQNVLEKTAKSIDTWFKGKERNQIPMFSSNITRPYRLIDALHIEKGIDIRNKLTNCMNFPTRTIDLNFDHSKIKCQLKINQTMKPYLNWIKLSVLNVNENLVCNCYNSSPVLKNNLYQSLEKNVFYLQNPQMSRDPLVLSIEKDGRVIDAIMFQIVSYIPPILCML
ncbi:mucosa-associated lymphoid tissue lymphoma translocation protein 1-like [Chelonus insularis]|uniref:mucosa-associated lymphoid tissue lymphoma translocation protein 1-like n=1 Tax=Chelonus insularis TaxID=460826 RepID=UPI00158A4D3B|nr:mucosa-associated lymphoid tissue lymphoma translocation protein 1-like [Chelonus insularis]